MHAKQTDPISQGRKSAVVRSTRVSATSRPDQLKDVRAALAGASSALATSPAEAISHAKRALTIASSIGDLKLQGAAALALAESQYRYGDLANAQATVELALSILENNGCRNRLGGAYRVQAALYLAQDHSGLFLAAASKALGYPDLTPSERARMFGGIAISSNFLFGPETAHAVIEDRAVPEARKSRDPGTLLSIYSLAALYEYYLACLAFGIPHYVTFGLEHPERYGSPKHRLQQAKHYFQLCEPYVRCASPRDRIWFLGKKAIVISLTEGASVGKPLFDETIRLAKAFPHSEAATLADMATAARVNQRWTEALASLRAARDHPAAQNDSFRREIHFELALVYRALGRLEEALESFETFTRINKTLSLLAATWAKDPANLRRYGERLDLSRLKTSVIEVKEPAALKRANGYIEENLNRRPTPAEIAHQAGISVRKLRSLYLQFRGVPVSDFIRERKMQHSKQMLQDKRLTIRQVSDSLGYSSCANFSRDFRKRFGRTPTDTRRLMESSTRATFTPAAAPRCSLISSDTTVN